MKHLFWPQCYEIRNQLEKKTSKKHKYVEAKQYATKQPMDHWRNQRGIQKVDRDKWQQKHIEGKQYATKQPMDHWRDQRENQNVCRNKWKHKDTKREMKMKT